MTISFNLDTVHSPTIGSKCVYYRVHEDGPGQGKLEVGGGGGIPGSAPLPSPLNETCAVTYHIHLAAVDRGEGSFD